MDKLKKALKEKTLVFGTERVLKKLRLGKLKEVFVSSNCPKRIKEDIDHYAKIGEIEVTKLEIKNDELGVACKKLFAISVLGY